MSEPAAPSDTTVAEAHVRKRYFSPIWLIPVIAALVAGYLGFKTYSERGPMVTIAFRTADGLSVGQTVVKYKSVTLGTVENITLKKDRTGVIAQVRMSADTDDILTDHTRFWIERPRLSTTTLSDIVAGTYIEVDPGETGGAYQTEFTALENQPALPADEPGSTFTLKADHLGSVNAGSPVFYRDMNVGTVLGAEVGDGSGPIMVNVSIREPYNKLVKASSRFWNASGLSIKLGSGGIHVEMQSLQSVIGGGVAFYTPPTDLKEPVADSKVVFDLYDDQKTAQEATYAKRVPYVTYMQSSIKDLAVGSPVQLFGIQVGAVTDVKLSYSVNTHKTRVRVAFQVEPDRAFGPGASEPAIDTTVIMQQLVENGMRVKMESSDLFMGQEILSLAFEPDAAAAQTSMEADAMVIPGESGGIDSLTDAIGDVAAKLNQIPFANIGKHLLHLMASADQTVSGPEMQKALHSLEETLANAESLSRTANENLTPALQRLPDLSAQMQTAVSHANELMSSVNANYGQDSDFQRDSKRVLDEVNGAARSIRLLADYLERHPEALIQGKPTDKGK